MLRVLNKRTLPGKNPFKTLFSLLNLAISVYETKEIHVVQFQQKQNENWNANWFSQKQFRCDISLAPKSAVQGHLGSALHPALLFQSKSETTMCNESTNLGHLACILEDFWKWSCLRTLISRNEELSSKTARLKQNTSSERRSEIIHLRKNFLFWKGISVFWQRLQCLGFFLTRERYTAVNGYWR